MSGAGVECCPCVCTGTAPCICGATSGDIPSPCSSQPAPARGDVRTPSSGWVGRRHGSQGLGMRRVELLRPLRGVGCVDTPQGAPCHRERSSSRRHKGAASSHILHYGLGVRHIESVTLEHLRKRSQGTQCFTMPSTPLNPSPQGRTRACGVTSSHHRHDTRLPPLQLPSLNTPSQPPMHLPAPS